MSTESTESKTENPSPGASVAVQPVVMREYSQGICQDGAAILCDGQMMTIEKILARLRTLEDVRAVICDAPELNHSNYDHNQVCELDTAVCYAWSIIEADA